MIPAHRAPLESNAQRHIPAQVVTNPFQDDANYWYCVLMIDLTDARKIATDLFARLANTGTREYHWAKLRVIANRADQRANLLFNVRRPRGQ